MLDGESALDPMDRDGGGVQLERRAAREAKPLPPMFYTVDLGDLTFRYLR
jgi:hypothetical protein